MKIQYDTLPLPRKISGSALSQCSLLCVLWFSTVTALGVNCTLLAEKCTFLVRGWPFCEERDIEKAAFLKMLSPCTKSKSHRDK